MTDSFLRPYSRTIMGILLMSVSGCAALQDCKYELNQRAYTAIAWSDFDADKRFCIVSSYSADFQRGWKAGFYSVITGGECRPPVIPPKKYWQPPLLLSCNECGCQEWYDGFRCGANAARHQPDFHYIKPWFSRRCEPCQVCETGGLDVDDLPPAIRLLGIEPLESVGDVEEANDTREPESSAAERDYEFPESTTMDDVAPAPADQTTELTPRPLPPSVPRMEQ